MINFKTNNLIDSGFKILLVFLFDFISVYFFQFKFFSELFLNPHQAFIKENSPFSMKYFLLQWAVIDWNCLGNSITLSAVLNKTSLESDFL